MLAPDSATQPKGIIATSVTALVPIVAMLDRLGLKNVGKTATSYAIQAYQTHLSPRKGFSCAHRRLHGELSCSEYFRQAVLSYGFSQAVLMFQQRLTECHQANLNLRMAIQSEPDSSIEAMIEASENDNTNDDNELAQNVNRKKSDPCDYGNCSDLSSCDCSDLNGLSFGSCDRNHNGTIDPNDCGGIDLTPDCGSADCGGADLGGCGDVGGCDIGGCDCSW